MNFIIQTPTPNLDQSLKFYTQLGFTHLSSSNYTLITDGTILLEINPERKARAGLKFYASDWSKELDQLKNYSKIIDIEGGHLLSDKSGVWWYLMNEARQFPDISDTPTSILGNTAGVSIEVIDIEQSIEMYKTMGFEKSMGGIEQGWLVMMHPNGGGISLMTPNACPHLFFNPSLTYFNGKNNLQVIENIRKSNTPITEEITVFNKENLVDNVILRDPGGLGFFIFSD